MNSIPGWIGRFFIRRTPYAVATPLGWSDGVYAKIARSEAFDESLSVRSVRRYQERLTFSKSISAACRDSVTTQQDVFVRGLSHANAAINLSTLLNWSRRPLRISVTTRMIAPRPTRPHKMFSSFGPQRPIGPSYWIEGTMWQKSHLRDFGPWGPDTGLQSLSSSPFLYMARRFAFRVSCARDKNRRRLEHPPCFFEGTTETHGRARRRLP